MTPDCEELVKMSDLGWPPASIIVFPTLWSGPWVWREQAKILASFAPNRVELLEAIVNWDVKPTLDDLDAYVLKRLESVPSPWLLMGCSLGGLIALRAALRRPEAVAAVVASGSPGLGRSGNLGFPAKFRLTFEEACEVRAMLFTDPSRVEDALLRKSVVDVSNRAAVHRGTKLVRELNVYDAWTDLVHLKVPTSLIWGADDKLSPPNGWRALARECSQVRFNAVPNAGHVPMLEAPDIFNPILATELAWVGSRAKAPKGDLI